MHLRPPPPVLLPLVLGAVLSAGCGSARPPASASSPPTSAAPEAGEAEAAIRAVLDRQVTAWNAGDVRGFMEGYDRNDSLTFVSGSTIRRGWQESLYAYVRNYPDRTAMGTLAFEDLEVRPLAPDVALVIGGWRLARAADEPSGLFSLVFRRGPGGWRIIHDHTSSATP